MKFKHWLRRFRGDYGASVGPRLRYRRSTCHRRAELLETRLCLTAELNTLLATPQWFDFSPSAQSSYDGPVGASAESFVGPLPTVRQFLVRLTPESTALAGSATGARSLFSAASGLTVTAGLGLPGQLIVTTTARDTVQIVESLRNNPAVAYFEEDFSVGATAFPDEQTESALFPRQYGLHNTGQTGGVADADIDAPEAWDITTGNVTTVIAQIDSGIDYTHPDLYLNIWLNQGELPEQFAEQLQDTDADSLITFRDLNAPSNSAFVSDLNGTGYIDAGDLLDDPRWADGIDTDANGFEDDLVGWDFYQNDNRPFDEHRHGTHVAGILGAVGDNGFGTVGVNWQTSIMPLRFLDEDNKGDISDAVEAINYTTMMRTRDEQAVNVRVSNNSWGTSGSFSPSLFDAVSGNAAADILFVAAAGNGDVLGQGINNDNTAFYPANLDLPNVVSVAALNDRGELATFSNSGIQTVDIAAPGVDIVSTEPGGNFISRSGTSMAVPHVAGTAALVSDQFPSATAVEVRDALLAGADMRGSLDGLVIGSRSLNAFGALTASTFAPVPTLQPVSDITATATEVVVTVNYQDDNAVDLTSLDLRDIELTRDGFSATRLTPFDVSASTMDGVSTAVYRIAAPGGEWDPTENGTWFVQLREGEIRDDEGLYTAPRSIGSFNVAIADPNVIFINTTADTVDADLMDGVPADTNGDTSLRAAIMHANHATAATTIVLPDGFYSLSIVGRAEDAAATGDLDVTSSHGVTIIGGGASTTVIDGKQLDRVFQIMSGTTAVLRGVTIQNGSTDSGGAIKNSGTLTVEHSLIRRNSAEIEGGGIANEGHLTINGSSIEDNRVTSRFFGVGGGGIHTSGATTLTGSSVVDNSASGSGGGIFLQTAALNLTKVTVVGNSADRGDGGGLLLQEALDVLLRRVTIVSNSATNGNGGGLMNQPTVNTQITVQGSVIADNSARTSADIEVVAGTGSTLTSDGTNLFGQPSETNTAWRSVEKGSADFDLIGTAQFPISPDLEPITREESLVQVAQPIPGGNSSSAHLAGFANQIVSLGARVKYSTAEIEPNDTLATAMRLDQRGWSLTDERNIGDAAVVPHVTVTGTGDETFDFYSFVVPKAGQTGTFDVDLADVAVAKRFDAALVLFDVFGTVLATNNTASVDAGSVSNNEPYLEYLFSDPGKYVIAVATSDSLAGFSDQLTNSPPPSDSEYQLHVSIPGHDLAPGEVLADYPQNIATGTEIVPAPLGPVFQLESQDPLIAPSVVTVQSLADGFDVTITSFVAADVNNDGMVDFVTATSSGLRVVMATMDGTFAPPIIYTADELSIPNLFNTKLLKGDVNGDGQTDILVVRENTGTITTLMTQSDGSFRDGVTTVLSGNVRPRELSIQDVNGDSVPDILFTDIINDVVGVLSGDSDGTFEVVATYDAGINPLHLDVADINGDHILDVASASANSRQVSLLFGQGDGTFLPGSPLPVSPGAQFAAPSTSFLADVTGDAIVDIVSAISLSNGIAVASGIGDGSFSEPILLPLAFESTPTLNEVKDYNSDGHLDLIVTVGTTTQVLVGDGAGSFIIHHEFDNGFSSGLASQNGGTITLDINQDGILDLPYRPAGSDVVAILHGRGDGSFRSLKPSLLTADRLLAMESGDLNSDGIPDLVTVHDNLDAVNVLIGIGDGGYRPPVAIAVGAGPVDIALVDMNEDHILDIVVAEADAPSVRILPGDGNGNFGPQVSMGLSAAPQSLVVSNSFGVDDGLDVNVRSGTNILTIPGNGDGTLRELELSYDSLSSSQDFLYADIDGDLDLDLVTTNGSSVLFHLRTGPTTFTFDSLLDVGTGIRAIVATDVNEDGWVDLLARDSVASEILVFLNSSGMFASPIRYSLSTAGDSSVGTDSLHVADIDGDGNADIATTNGRPSRSSGGSTLSFLKGNGNGTFRSAVDYAAGRQVIDLAIVDGNGDGTSDVVAASYYDGVVSTLLGDRPRTLQLRSDGLHDLPDLTPLSTTQSMVQHIVSVDSDGFVGLWTYANNPDRIRREAVILDSGRTESDISVVSHSSGLIVSSDTAHRLVNPSNGSVSPLRTGNSDAEFSPHLFTTVQSSLAEVMLPLDLNGDDRLDLIYIDGFAGLKVQLQNVDGTFTSQQRYVSQTDDGTFVFPQNLAFGLFNDDGAVDVIAVNDEHGSISVFLGDGLGGFPTVEIIDVGLTPRFVELADIDGDSVVDIVVGEEGAVRVLTTDGTGMITGTQTIPAPDDADTVIVADIDGDLDNDLIVSGFNFDGSRRLSIDVLLNDSNGSFTLASQLTQEVTLSSRSSDIAVKDVDQDGHLDIVAVYGERTGVGVDRDSLIVARGSGDGTFGTPMEFEVPDDPIALLVEDVTGDGAPDALTAHSGPGGLSLLVGNGDGSFRDSVELFSGTGMRTLRLFAADFNGDSIPDPIAAFNGVGNGTVVLETQSLVGDVTTVAGQLAVVGAKSIVVYEHGPSAMGTARLLPDITTSQGTVKGDDYSLLKFAPYGDGLAGLVQIESSAPYADIILFDSSISSGESLLLTDTRTITATDRDSFFVNGTDIFLTAEVQGDAIGSEPFMFSPTTGLQLIGDLLNGPESSVARDFLSIGDTVFFTALSERTDTQTGNLSVRRDVIEFNRTTFSTRIVRAGLNVDGTPAGDGTALFFSSSFDQTTEGRPWTFKPGLAEVPSIGAFDATAGSVAGVVFLDRDGDGVQGPSEPGRAGVSIFVDLNRNGRREANEPTVVSQLDDPSTAADETGRYRIDDLPSAEFELRELTQAGFTPTSPLTVQPGLPTLTELAHHSAADAFGLPSITAYGIVYVNTSTNALVRQSISGISKVLVDSSTIVPDEISLITSIQPAHAQDGSNIAVVATLADNREVVLRIDDSDLLSSVASTGPLNLDIEGDSNGGFDSLSISGDVVSYFGTGDSPSVTQYGSFGKKCPIHSLKSSAIQHRKKIPRMSAGRLAIDCSFRRARCFNSFFVFAW